MKKCITTSQPRQQRVPLGLVSENGLRRQNSDASLPVARASGADPLEKIESVSQRLLLSA